MVDVVVVGAGFAGLYLVHRLREAGFGVRVFEASEGLGGVWHWNRYPGARCDVPSVAYSYSFSPELEKEWDWSEKYATQPEILRYLNHVADRFDLRRAITFNVRMTAACWDGDSQRWTVETDSGERVEARFVVMATGCLSRPKAIDIVGADRFVGPVYYTYDWPKDGVDFSEQSVGVIGTGSSGIQSIPLIAEQAKALTVFQRTPVFSFPARNRPLAENEARAHKADYAAFRAAQRQSPGGVPRIMPPGPSALSVPHEERTAFYEECWHSDTPVRIYLGYSDILLNRDANETVAEFVRGKIGEIVRDPKIADRLSPRSFPVGTKRLCLDTGYYETFNLPHVELVDLRKTPIVEITADGVRTSERDVPLDALVFATGFDAMTGALLSVDIRGVKGQSLREKWRDGPHTYLGLAVAGFPNLFTVTGPFSPSVLTNTVASIEQHVEWIVECMAALRERGAAVIEAREDAEEAWGEHNAEVAAGTLFPQADSWYMGANVANKPRVCFPYVGGLDVYREKCDAIAAEGYTGFAIA